MRLGFRVNGATISNLNTRDIVWASLSEYIHALVYGAIPLEGEKRESSGSCVVFPSPHLCLSQAPVLQPNHTYCLEFPQTELRTMSHLRGLQWSSLSFRADGLVSSVYIYSLICLYHCVLTAFISETCHFVIPYPASFPGPSSNVSNWPGNEAIT